MWAILSENRYGKAMDEPWSKWTIYHRGTLEWHPAVERGITAHAYLYETPQEAEEEAFRLAFRFPWLLGKILIVEVEQVVTRGGQHWRFLL
jgi:hypothetical protein